MKGGETFGYSRNAQCSAPSKKSNNFSRRSVILAKSLWSTASHVFTRSLIQGLILMKAVARRLSLSVKCRRCITAQRSFATAPLWKQNATPEPNARTTHFGFETVSEAEKEGRGMHWHLQAKAQLTVSSWSCLLLCGRFLRYNE